MRSRAGLRPGPLASRFPGPRPANNLRKIVWTDDAVGHLEAILTYVAAFDPVAATRLAERLIEVADGLAEFSERGRDAGGGLREMTTVWPYILRYRVEADKVIVLRIRHGARDEEDESA